MSAEDIEKECINTIRAISADQPESAKSGHPGAPMGCAPMAHVLWGENVMKYSSSDPEWLNRDRFVLSNGHACALQYSMLHLTGYGLAVDDLRNFRKLGSKTPGHPECFLTAGVEVCTGPLGQGISNAIGIAMAERHMAATYNTTDFPAVFDHYTYVICGDGCMQEGVASEASSLAGHLGLGKLIVMYDDNNITIDGETSLSFTEDVLKRYDAYGWHTQTVSDVVSSLDELRTAIKNAQDMKDKPSIIKVKTAIGYGSPSKEGKETAHGAPLGKDDLAGTKKFYGLPPDEMFHIGDTVKEFYKKAAGVGNDKRTEWEKMFASYTAKYPDKASEISRRYAKKLPDGLLDKLPTFNVDTDKDQATRKWSQHCLAAVGPHMPELIGGSADLTPSNCTHYSKDLVDYQKDTPEGRYLRFGVREHGMCAIVNGMYSYGGIRPYCATFLVFTGYCIGAIRLSALSKFGVLYIMTHDSIGLGEDGPTHQPIETIAMLRNIPNLYVYRPADCNEMSSAYYISLSRPQTPMVICCSRSTVKSIKDSTIEKANKGAYIAYDTPDNKEPALILIATGSEVGPCLDAATELNTTAGIPTRVVSMPCQELFMEQSVEYRKSILPGNIPTISVEAATTFGWYQYSHIQIGMKTFGASGNGNDVFKHFGFTADNIIHKGKALIEYYKNSNIPIPDLNNRPNI